MTDRKKRLLQINITANWGSHGKIAESIGQIAINNGWDEPEPFKHLPHSHQPG